MRFDYPLIKSEDYGHNSPQTASLKRVGFMLRCCNTRERVKPD